MRDEQNFADLDDWEQALNNIDAETGHTKSTTAKPLKWFVAYAEVDHLKIKQGDFSKNIKSFEVFPNEKMAQRFVNDRIKELGLKPTDFKWYDKNDGVIPHRITDVDKDAFMLTYRSIKGVGRKDVKPDSSEIKKQIMLKHNGEVKSQKEWAKELGIEDYSKFGRDIRAGKYPDFERVVDKKSDTEIEDHINRTGILPPDVEYEKITEDLTYNYIIYKATESVPFIEPSSLSKKLQNDD